MNQQLLEQVPNQQASGLPLVHIDVVSSWSETANASSSPQAIRQPVQFDESDAVGFGQAAIWRQSAKSTSVPNQLPMNPGFGQPLQQQQQQQLQQQQPEEDPAAVVSEDFENPDMRSLMELLLTNRLWL